VLGRKSHF